MKKILVLLFACLCGYGAMAELPINFGVHGGISSNRIKIKDLQRINGVKDNSGYMVGAFMRLNLGKMYLEPSLNYSHRKSIAEGTNNNIYLTRNSFDIPVMVGLQVLDLSVIKLRAFLGPELSVGKMKNLKELGNISADKTSWSGKVGVGVDVWKFTFDIDYQKAFKNLSDVLKSPRSFNFTLGFKII